MLALSDTPPLPVRELFDSIFDTESAIEPSPLAVAILLASFDKAEQKRTKSFRDFGVSKK